MDEAHYKLKKIVDKLEKIKGRHTELVSVYVPPKYSLDAIRTQLSSEADTASNIKSKPVRQNVITAIEKMISELRKYKKTPENGLVLFSGNISEVEGKPDYQLWVIHPPEPINIKLYRCDSFFVIEPLKEQLEAKYSYGLIVLDHKDANLALLKGRAIVFLHNMRSFVTGKMKAGGQCVIPSTLVQKSNGEIVEISKLMKNEKLCGVDFQKNKVADLWCIEKWRTKKGKIYNIITKNPRLGIETSENHEFLVLNKEGISRKRAKDLAIGEYLLTPEKINIVGSLHLLKTIEPIFVNVSKKGKDYLKSIRLKKKKSQLAVEKEIGIKQANLSAFERDNMNLGWKNLKKLCNILDVNFNLFVRRYCKKINLPKVLNKALAQIVGYLIGDGSIEEYRLSFFEERKEVAKAYAQKLEKLFNSKAHLIFRKDKNYYQIRIYGSPIVKLIVENFEIGKGQDRRVPKKISEAKEEIVGAFLKGIFDAEGYASSKLALGINNKILSHQISLLLLRFGIISSVVTYDNKKNPYSNNARYTIEISDKKSLESFKKNIGFTSREKMNKLNRLISKKSNVSYNRQILIPGNKILDIAREFGLNTRSFPKVASFFRDKRKMSKYIFMHSIVKEVKNPTLKKKLMKILSYEIMPTQIKEIHISHKNAEMIDIAMQNENFIANRLVVHNSAPRFQRERQEEIKQFFKKFGEKANKSFSEIKNLNGILIGGPGPAKEDFYNGDFLSTELKKKVIAVKDISDTGEHGIRELVMKSKDILSKEDIIIEKIILEKLFKHLAKDDGFSSYGEAEVMENLKKGAVETLLLSDTLPEEKIEEFSEISKEFGSKVILISTETQEGVQLKELGGFGAILRYKTT